MKITHLQIIVNGEEISGRFFDVPFNMDEETLAIAMNAAEQAFIKHNDWASE